MNKLIVHSPDDQPTRPERAERPYLFISYSHHDAGPAREFYTYLLATAQLSQLAAEDIYFAPEKLRAGDEWLPDMQAAIERANVVIFLTSFQSLASTFCMQKELPVAAERNARIVPVVLRSCPWKDIPIPDSGKKLGAYQAAPYHVDSGDVRPVMDWKHADDGWNAALQQIHGVVAETFARQKVSIPSAHSPRRNPPVPYLGHRCDQLPVCMEFREALKVSQQPNLVVLAKGIHADDVHTFWTRLESDLLGVHCKEGQCRLMEQVFVQLPNLARDRMPPRMLAEMIRGELSEAVRKAHEATLQGAANPQGEKKTLTPILTFLPDATQMRDLRNIVRQIAEFFNSATASSAAQGFVLVILIESEELHTLNLTRLWGLNDFSLIRAIELPPLRDVEDPDARSWYWQEKITRWAPELSEDAFLQKIQLERGGQNVGELRLRRFNEIVKQLLNNP